MQLIDKIRLTTIPIGFCVLSRLISTASSTTKFIKGSKPRNIPFTTRLPFSLTVDRMTG